MCASSGGFRVKPQAHGRATYRRETMNIVSISVPAVIKQSYLSESQKTQCEKAGMTVTRSALGDMDEVELSGNAESKDMEARIVRLLQRISR